MRRPKLARDTVWLASSDGLAIIFGLIGQVILAKARLQSDYGLRGVILEAFASITWPIRPKMIASPSEEASHTVSRANFGLRMFFS
jgi:hypothetical protein